MPYQGMVRVDLGPFAPQQKSMMPVCRTVSGSQVNGLECRIDTPDFGRITIEAFDDNAIIDIMDASNQKKRLARLIALDRAENRVRDEITRLSYTVLDEDPAYGMAGDPIRAARLRTGGIRKAVSAHGRIMNAERYSSGGTKVLVINILCGTVPVSAACKMANATRDMLRILETDEAWIRASGFGDIVNLKVDGKLVWRVYINNLQFFTEAVPKEIRGKKVDPGRVNEKLRECSVIPLE